MVRSETLGNYRLEPPRAVFLQPLCLWLNENFRTHSRITIDGALTPFLLRDLLSGPESFAMMRPLSISLSHLLTSPVPALDFRIRQLGSDSYNLLWAPSCKTHVISLIEANIALCG